MIVGSSPARSTDGRDEHVLVVTDDVLTTKMAGPAIRAWHIAEARPSNRTWSWPRPRRFATSPLGTSRWSPPTGRACRTSSDGVMSLSCRVISSTTSPSSAGLGKVMVFDLYDPLHLEALELTRRGPGTGALRSMSPTPCGRSRSNWCAGDFFICASDKQRDLWLGFLAALGRINPSTYEDGPHPSPTGSTWCPSVSPMTRECTRRAALRGVRWRESGPMTTSRPPR